MDHVLSDINFNGHFLINNNISIPKKVINLYISCKLNPWLRHLSTDFALKNSLFGPVKLIKNTDAGKYQYSGYGLGFDCRSEFLFTDGSMEKMSLFLELI